MYNISLPLHGSAIRALSRDIVETSDWQARRIVAMVDAMATRGQADQLIVPLRRQHRTSRLPRPLRFKRLLFTPLDQLMAPADRWEMGQNTIPRSALTPMADHVRQVMGREADAIARVLMGKTTTDAQLITRLGRKLWPMAARILADSRIPDSWATTGLTASLYRPLADIIVALLDQASPLAVLCGEATHRLLPPQPEAIAAMVSKTAFSHAPALPTLIAVMLLKLPQSAAAIRGAYFGSQAAIVRVALEEAADQLLRQMGDEKVIEARIAAGSLEDASGAVMRITTLLDQFRTDLGKPRRREQIRAVRHQLDGCCRKRFAMAVQNDFLPLLLRLDRSPTTAAIEQLETAARGLRALEIEARGIGSASLYDLLLRKAVQAVQSDVMRAKLTPLDQMRLVEILAGPDAALAMLAPNDQPSPPVAAKTMVPRNASPGESWLMP